MLRTVRYNIVSPRVPAEFDGFTIAHLSDLHGELYGQKNCILEKKIHEINPDIVVMTGDMADTKDGSVFTAANLCLKLLKRYPLYYVQGNHEQAMTPAEWMWLRESIRPSGVMVLENQWQTIFRKGAFLRIYGLVMDMPYYKDPKRDGYVKDIHFSAEDVRQALGEADEDAFNILLCHNPLYFPSYRDWGADLTLAGHIHGGIIRIPGVGGLLSPDLTLFPKYDGGHFEEEGRQMVVSRGLGNHFLFRVMNPAELVAVTLKAGEEKR